ncbi:uncharacterized protein [Typha latifolia]|uniref:uncharacterized protein isoform X1 n=1 Tax=Typha latifolia TaxID=4733 RepID=UPI003C2EAA20
MDKNKNRTDLLAAGRKKLQQFRKKKDNKGSSVSQGKSASKKVGKDGGASEPVKIPDPEATSSIDPDDHVDSASVPSVGDVDGGVSEDLEDQEEVSMEISIDGGGSRSEIEKDQQEAKQSGLEQFDSGDLQVEMAIVDNRSVDTDMLEGAVVAESRSGLEEAPCVGEFLDPTGESNERESSLLSSGEILEAGCVDREMREDRGITDLNGQESGKDGTEEGTADCGSQKSVVSGESSGICAPSRSSHVMDMNVIREYTTMQEMDKEVSDEHAYNNYSEENEEASISPKVTSDKRLEEELEDVALKQVSDDVIGGVASGSVNEESIVPQLLLKDLGGDKTESSGELLAAVDVLLPQEKVELVEEDNPVLRWNSKELFYSMGTLHMLTRDVKEGLFADGLESIRRHVYLSNLSRDLLELQLDEQTDMDMKLIQHSSDEVWKLQELVKETEESKEVISEELACCRSKLRDVTTAKEEVESNFASVKEEIVVYGNRCQKLQCELEHCQEELKHSSAELANCRASLEAFQEKNLSVTRRLMSEEELRMKLEEEKEFLSCENLKLSSELLEQKERLLRAFDKHKQLESNIRETGTCFENFVEQLIEENLYLSNSLAVHKGKIKELDDEYTVLPIERESYQDNTSHLENLATDITVEDSHKTIQNLVVSCHPPDFSLQNVDEKYSGNLHVLQVLKGHLEEAKGILHELEKSIHRMHSHSISVGRSSGRASSSGISKLIQAFESKANQIDSTSEEEVPLTEGGLVDESYTLTGEQTCHLECMLKQMELDVEKAEIYLIEEYSRREFHKKFEMEYEMQGKHNESSQGKIDELIRLLCNYEDRINVLQNQFNSIQQVADNEAERLLNQVELLQEEVNDRMSVLKHEKNSVMEVIVKAIEKLNLSTGLLLPNESPNELDFDSHVLTSMDFVTKSIQSLHEKLGSANLIQSTLSSSLTEVNKELTDVQGRKKLAVQLMKKMYNTIGELLPDFYHPLHESEINEDGEEGILLLFSHYELLLKHLKNLLDDRLDLLSKNNELESKLLGKSKEAEELEMRCDTFTKNINDLCQLKEDNESILMSKNLAFEELHKRCFVLWEKLEYHNLHNASSVFLGSAGNSEPFAKSGCIETEFFISLLPRMEASVALHLQKYEEAVEEINLSKKCLSEVNILPEISASKWSLPLPSLLGNEFFPMLNDLQDRVDMLSGSKVQLETEIQVLKGCLKMMEETLEASRSALNLKTSELEQSELRISAVKEKLSIAVAKGKGLIVQRDGLKQSLMEKSNELEKCSQELQRKEALLKEVEQKLKSYTEVDRIEALESELSYIRNSATALRDSFLLKDSILQRIEEVLEDLDLPEHFHSRDIVEKVEFLSKIAGESSIAVDFDHKSSVGGPFSDSRTVVMDAWKDGLQNPGFDELKSKYDELQRKFYSLAEHNDMLEQSLVERNYLVQKWEEALNRINMPSQVGTLEPEYRIEWLGNSLAEVQRERDGLQLKIDNLEESSEMLIVDLEESHKKISELSAEVVAIKAEKDFFSESLDKLRFEYLGLSERAVQDGMYRDALRKEVADMEEKMVEKTKEHKYYHDMENEIYKLVDVINNVLPSDGSNTLSGHSAIEYLEEILRKLLEKYAAAISERSISCSTEKELLSQESNLSVDKCTLEASTDEKETELITLKHELGEACQNLALLKEERDAAVEKYQSLMVEEEAIVRQRNLLQEEKTLDMQKYESLVAELESVIKQRDALQEQLTQEEHKSASVRDKLNVAVRKGKGLVQQRDSLKQAMEEMNSVIENLRIEHKQYIEALDSEKLVLMKRLTETEESLQDSNKFLRSLLTALHGIDTSQPIDIADSVGKIEEMRKLSCDLRSAVISSENEAKKSKQSAELLLAELNEVQERADILQEELARAEDALTESSNQTDFLEAARADAVHHLENFISVHSQERKKQIDNLLELNSAIGKLKKFGFEFSSSLANIFTRDVDIICHIESIMDSLCKQIDGANMANIPVISSNYLPVSNTMNQKNYVKDTPSELKVHDGSSISEHLAVVCRAVFDCLMEYNGLKRGIDEHAFSIEEQAVRLLKIVGTVQRKYASQNEQLESLKGSVTGLELEMQEKGNEICSMCKNLSLLYEACSKSLAEAERTCYHVREFDQQEAGAALKLSGYINGQGHPWHTFPVTEEDVRSMADKLGATIKGMSNKSEDNSRELKETVLELQRELQEKDIQMNRNYAELISQIRAAETVAKQSSVDLDIAKSKINDLEKQVDMMENNKKLLELRIGELKDNEASSNELQEKIKHLTDLLTVKEQEIESLMQALDEEEKEMEDFDSKNKELENLVEEKTFALKSLEASRAKAVEKLSTMVSKFDELHDLSESLLAEVENLQSQLQERDSEVSFLRHEVTKSTDDLFVSQETNKKYSSEIQDLMNWLDTTILRFGVHHKYVDDYDSSQIHVQMDVLDKKMRAVFSELDDLQVTVQSKDALLQIERRKVEELLCKSEVLENSLNEKKAQIELLQQVRNFSGQPTSMSSVGSVEIENMKDKAPAAVVTHVRSGRKVNNDQVAIAIDVEKNDSVLDDEDDDKAHGFKSLTMSRLVPRAIRPITDRIDGIWVSADRLLMRQPSLRLGFLIYWITLHALLATLI